MTEPTLKQWKRRALVAEAECEKLRQLRTFDKETEMSAAREMYTYRVALKEAQDAIVWALGETE